MTSFERRVYPRFEPPIIVATVSFKSGLSARGRVLDASMNGMAITLFNNIDLKESEETIFISIQNGLYAESREIGLGEGSIVRKWTDSHGDIVGIALKFDGELTDNCAKLSLLDGPQKNIKMRHQAQLYQADTDYLGNYRRDLINSELKLLSLALTLSVTLAGAYFALGYYSTATANNVGDDLRFWRILIAALPGLLSGACAVMGLSNSKLIQCIDAYLLIIKKYLIRDMFPRQYCGWESAHFVLVRIFKSEKCFECQVAQRRPCGTLRESDVGELISKRLFRRPGPNAIHGMMYFIFTTIILFSVTVVLSEAKNIYYQSYIYIIIVPILLIIFIGLLAKIIYIVYHLSKGKFSTEYYKRCWEDILTNCGWPV